MKKLKAFFAVLLTVATLSHSTPSQATVGIFTVTPVLIAGLAITGGGAIGTAISAGKCSTGEAQGLCQALMIILGIPVLALGLIVLEGEQEIAFRELNSAEAEKIGVSSNDLEIYNSEIDQANMLMADVKTELSRMNKPTAKDASKVWNDVKELVSPATYSTMQKIATQK